MHYKFTSSLYYTMHIVNKTLSGHHKYILLNHFLGLLKHTLILQKLTLNSIYVTRIYKITLSGQYRYILLSFLVARPNRALIFPNFPPKQTFQFDKGQHFLSAAGHTTRSFWSKRYPRGSYRVPPQRASIHKSVGDISEARQSASSLDLCFHNETYPRSTPVSSDSWRNERTKQEREKESKVGKEKKIEERSIEPWNAYTWTTAASNSDDGDQEKSSFLA